MADPWLNPVWWLVVTAAAAALGGVVSFAASQTAGYLWQRWLSRRLRKKAEVYAKAHANRVEVALVASVLNDIRKAAENHLTKNGREGIPVFQVFQKEGFSNEDDGQWAAYLERVKTEGRKMRDLGAQRIYLFCNLPVAMAVFVGATLTNGPEVIVHHFASGVYYPVGRLAVDTVRL